MKINPVTRNQRLRRSCSEASRRSVRTSGLTIGPAPVETRKQNMFCLRRLVKHDRLSLMSHDEIPLDQIESARDLPLPEQAQCLLTVISPMFLAMHAKSGTPVDDALYQAESRQTFCECVESLCRPLNKHEVEQLFALTIMALGERLTVTT